jgi:hypothetical protein
LHRVSAFFAELDKGFLGLLPPIPLSTSHLTSLHLSFPFSTLRAHTS